MKKIISSSLLIAAAVSANAAPLVTIGDQLDLFFKGAVIGKWDSNITYSNANKIDDYSATIRLGAEADYGRNSKFKANVKFYEDLTRYANHTEFNSNLAHVSANASYTEANYSVKAKFAFDQMFQNTTSMLGAGLPAGELVRYNTWLAGVDGSYDFSEKLFGELGFNWHRTEYVGSRNDGFKWGDIYSDYDVYSVPVSILYRITPKISAGLTYQYRNTEYSGGRAALQALGSTRDDHFGGLTIRGDLLPKLTASIYAGMTYRDYDNDDDLTFALNASVSYALTEKVSLFVTGRRDFGNGASRQSMVETGCEAGANYMMNQFITFTTSFAYMNSDYMGMDRKDDEYIGRFGVTYTPNKFLSFAANYRYLNNSSSRDGCSYMQHLFSISASVKY